MKYWPLLCFILIGTLIACQTEPASEEGPVSENPPEVQQEETYRIEIEKQLNAYYLALSAENIDASQFFAPEVAQFFSAKNVDPQRVQQSLETSFAANDARQIQLDSENLRVQKIENGYEALVSGEVRMLNKDPQSFNNRILFDSQYRITHYLPMAAAKSSERKAGGSRKMAPEVVDEVLNAFRTGAYESAQPCIHPRIGFYVVVKPGAMPTIYHGQDATMLPQKVSWVKDGWKQLLASPDGDQIPAFDCEKGFAENGSYFAELDAPYDGLSELLGYLQEFELTDMGKQEAAALKKAESHISRKLVDTQADAAMYFGEIDGKWYLLAVDLSEYDCSA